MKEFSIARGPMLALISDMLGMPPEKRSALLGRFQHLQRLSLISGINPGRGKAAEYSAHQLTVICIAFELLQFGLSPERVVSTIRNNKDIIFDCILLAVSNKNMISPSFLNFDPSVITESRFNECTNDIVDRFSSTFISRNEKELMRDIEGIFVSEGYAERMSILNVSGMLRHLIAAADGGLEKADLFNEGFSEWALYFLHSLREWVVRSTHEDVV